MAWRRFHNDSFVELVLWDPRNATGAFGVLCHILHSTRYERKKCSTWNARMRCNVKKKGQSTLKSSTLPHPTLQLSTSLQALWICLSRRQFCHTAACLHTLVSRQVFVQYDTPLLLKPVYRHPHSVEVVSDDRYHKSLNTTQWITHLGIHETPSHF